MFTHIKQDKRNEITNKSKTNGTRRRRSKLNTKGMIWNHNENEWN